MYSKAERKKNTTTNNAPSRKQTGKKGTLQFNDNREVSRQVAQLTGLQDSSGNRSHLKQEDQNSLPGLKSFQSQENTAGVLQRKPVDFVNHPIHDIEAKTGLFRTSHWKALQVLVEEYAQLDEKSIKERRAKLREIGVMAERWMVARKLRDGGQVGDLDEEETEKYHALMALLDEVKNEYTNDQDPDMLSSPGTLNVPVPQPNEVYADPEPTSVRKEKDGRRRGYLKGDAQLIDVNGAPIGEVIPCETVCRVEKQEELPKNVESPSKYCWIRPAPVQDNEWGEQLDFTPGYVLIKNVVTTALEKKNPDLVYENRTDPEIFPLFQGPPSVEDVEQVSLGDCYLLAAVLSIVRKDPAFFPSIMMDHGNGIVTVRLYDVTENPDKSLVFNEKYIHVNKSVVVNKKQKTRVDEGYNKGALWVQMLEKAYAAGGFIGTTSEKIPSKKNSWSQIASGFAKHALEIITGEEATEYPISDNNLGTMEEGKTWVSMSQKFKKMTQKKGLLDNENYFQRIYMDGELSDFEEALIQLHETRDQVRKEEVMNLLPVHIPDTKLRKRVAEFLDDKKFYPGKRGTGTYSDYQLTLFDEIAEAINDGKKVVLGSKDSMKRRGGNNSGSSGGEHVYRGLAGPHGYEVVDCEPRIFDKDNVDNTKLLWVKLRNPWGKTGRKYKDGSFGVEQPGGMERVPLGGLKTSEEPTEDAEFWLLIEDLTKRFNRLTTQ
ncbi:C2 family cysteine protease [Fluviicola sp.]|uniref:C2 family cysteine protease n=1 Tax=Fluviicola sp. TaxID=1917219 RepID=UPI0031D07DDE